MTSDRTQILSPEAEQKFIDLDPLELTPSKIHGEENLNFTNDEPSAAWGTAADAQTDNFDVIFRTDSSAISFCYRPNVPIEGVEDGSDEEVAAHVSNTDDPTIAVLTFRSWFLGLLFTCLLSFVNQFFWYRTSPLFVGTLVAQLLTYPLGKLLAKVLPTRKFHLFRWSFTLNPGPFTIKEHCIITAMANATCVR